MSTATKRTIKQTVRENFGGFLTEETLPQLVKEERLCRVVVRCGSGRFLCSAQDAAHFMEIIRKEGSDYVRDCGLAAN